MFCTPHSAPDLGYFWNKRDIRCQTDLDRSNSVTELAFSGRALATGRTEPSYQCQYPGLSAARLLTQSAGEPTFCYVILASRGSLFS